MKYTSSRLICFSPTHSSHLIGESIIRGLDPQDLTETDLTYEKPDGTVDVSDDITVIVVPVYGGRVPLTALERMENIRGNGLPVIPVVVYGNRDYEDALLELKDWCIAHNFLPIAAAAFIGEHSYSRPGRPIAEGRPDGNDLQIAEQFGKKIAEKSSDTKELNAIAPWKVKGNFPYKERGTKTPQTPVTIAELCTQCGLCIGICPVGAIRLENEVVSEADVCIKCCACVKYCPNEARVFDTPYTDMLFRNFKYPRVPELFYCWNFSCPRIRP
ncbi:MAG: 4Fe-4S binding protein [Odoribacter sp.]